MKALRITWAVILWGLSILLSRRFGYVMGLVLVAMVMHGLYVEDIQRATLDTALALLMFYLADHANP